MKYLILLVTTVLSLMTLAAQDEQGNIKEIESTTTKEVQVEEEDGILHIQIITTDDQGNENVMIWKGATDDPDMPEDVKVHVFNHERSDIRKEKKIRLKTLDEDGNEQLLEWDGEGEMPAEMQKLMDENGHDVDLDRQSQRSEMRERHQEIRKERKDSGYNQVPEFRGRAHKHRYGGKAKLGVKISDDNDIVKVEELIDNSAASKGGMEANDIITVVDDTDIDSLNRLYAELATHNPGDKVKVTVKRNGKKKVLSIVLD